MLHFLVKIFIPFILPLCAINLCFNNKAIANSYFTGTDQIDHLTLSSEEFNKNTRNKKESKELGAIIDKVNSKIKADSAEFSGIIEKTKTEMEKESYKADSEILVNLTKDNFNNLANPEINESNITARALNDYKKLYQSTKDQNSCKAGIKDGLKIFISFSMPKELIKNYDKIARKIGAKIILRGLINNSFKDTISYIKQLNDQGMMIDIDPRPFEEFKIDLVPSFVLSHSNHHDKLVGSVSVIYALEQFADNGDLSIRAKEYLSKLSDQLSGAEINVVREGRDREGSK